MIAGDGMIAAEHGPTCKAHGHAATAARGLGRHRFVATFVYVLSDRDAAAWADGDVENLDHNNLMDMGVVCWACEGALGEVTHDSMCPAPPAP